MTDAASFFQVSFPTDVQIQLVIAGCADEENAGAAREMRRVPRRYITRLRVLIPRRRLGDTAEECERCGAIDGFNL